MEQVTDPSILAQLNTPDSGGMKPVTDPALLDQLNAPEEPENIVGGLLGNVVQNAEQDLNPLNIAKSLGLTVKEGAEDLPKDITQGLAQKVAGVVSGEPQGPNPIDKRLEVIANSEQVQAPGKWAYEHPVDAAMTVLPLVGLGMDTAPFVSDIASKAADTLGGEGGAVSLGGKAPLSERAVNAAFEPSEEATRISEKAGSKPTLEDSAQAKIMSTIFGPSQEAIMARMKTPEAVTNYQSAAELSHQLPADISKLSDQISKAEGAAYETLGTTPEAGGIPKQNVLGIIQGVRAEMGDVITPAEERAAGVLDKLHGSLEKSLPDTVPEYQLKDTLKRLNKAIDWDNPESGTANSALKAVKGTLNAMLKKQNPAYEAAMKPVEQLTGLHDDLLNQFNVKRVPGGGYEPTLQTEGKLANVLSKNKSMTQDTLARLKEATGRDYLEDLKNSKLGAQFEKGAGKANGSRRVVAGTAIGEGIGRTLGIPWVGGAAGAGVGMFLDTFGGEMAGKIIDFLNTPEGQQYKTYFKSSLAKGPQALRVLDTLLKQKDKDYAEATGGVGMSHGGLIPDDVRAYCK
jgi:hypothetical protein